MQFFPERFAGAPGHRVTATAGNVGGLVNTMVWRVAPPCVDFIGAFIVFSTVAWPMALAMSGFVLVVTVGLVVMGQRGRPLHQAYAGEGRRGRRRPRGRAHQHLDGEGLLSRTRRAQASGWHG